MLIASYLIDMQALNNNQPLLKEPSSTAAIRYIHEAPSFDQVKPARNTIIQSRSAGEVNARENKNVHYGKGYSPDGPMGGYGGL